MSESEIAADDAIIKRSELHTRLSVHSDTVRRWIKEQKIPAPDFNISRKSRGWKQSTLRAAGINI